MFLTAFLLAVTMFLTRMMADPRPAAMMCLAGAMAEPKPKDVHIHLHNLGNYTTAIFVYLGEVKSKFSQILKS